MENMYQLKDIADRQEISKKYLEQIMTMLSKGKIYRNNKRNIGGYKLTETT